MIQKLNVSPETMVGRFYCENDDERVYFANESCQYYVGAYPLTTTLADMLRYAKDGIPVKITCDTLTIARNEMQSTDYQILSLWIASIETEEVRQ